MEACMACILTCHERILERLASTGSLCVDASVMRVKRMQPYHYYPGAVEPEALWTTTSQVNANRKKAGRPRRKHVVNGESGKQSRARKGKERRGEAGRRLGWPASCGWLGCFGLPFSCVVYARGGWHWKLEER
jgi:hypothetical protein